MITLTSTNHFIKKYLPFILGSFGLIITVLTLYNIFRPLKVVSSDPYNNQIEVYPGEIEISILTNKQIKSSEDILLEFNPALSNYYKIINPFPSNEIKFKLFGGLKTNTKYHLTFKDKKGDTIYEWSFTTSNIQPESSSALVSDKELELKQKFYPLADHVPFRSSDFDIDYKDDLFLVVKVKNKNTQSVKDAVISWIKSKGVDPNTHKIEYINVF